MVYFSEVNVSEFVSDENETLTSCDHTCTFHMSGSK